MARRRPALDPRYLPGAKFVWDMDAEWAAAGLSPGSTVALQTVTDQMGNGCDITQASATLRATLRWDGVRPCLTPDAIDDAYTATSGGLANFTNGASVVWGLAAFRPVSEAVADVLLTISRGGSGTPRLQLSANGASTPGIYRINTVRSDSGVTTSKDILAHSSVPMIGVGICDHTRGIIGSMAALDAGQFAPLTWAPSADGPGVIDSTDSLRVRLFANAGTAAGNLYNGDFYYLVCGANAVPTEDQFQAAMRFLAIKFRLPVRI